MVGRVGDDGTKVILDGGPNPVGGGQPVERGPGASVYVDGEELQAPAAPAGVPTGPLGDLAIGLRVGQMLEHLSDYPPSQAEYFAELYRKFLIEGGASGNVYTDVTAIDFFARLDDATRAEYIWELADLAEDPSLLELASTLTVADLQMNGGLGSGMGLDPREHHSKVTGVHITLDLPGVGEVSVPIMTAKLEMYARKAGLFGAYHLVMLNSTITRDGWDAFIYSKFPGASETMMERAERNGVQVKSDVVQYAFPLLNRDSKRPIKTRDRDLGIAAGGHGQFIFELYFSGRLQEMVSEDVDVVFFGNADNFQSKPSPLISAKLIKEGKMGVMVSTDRTTIDTVNGGIFGLKDGRLTIVEFKEASAEQRELYRAFGLVEGDKPQPFNTNSIYLNAPRLLAHLDEIRSTKGDRAVRELLTPNLIAGSKPREDLSKGSIQAAHLEGAIGSVVLKLPDIAIANTAAEVRTTQFAPIKRPYEVVMMYDSDAFALELERDGLRKRGYHLPPTFVMTGWDGWKDLAATRAALGHPSMKDLQSLSIHGPVKLPDAMLSGQVVINNPTGVIVDLTAPAMMVILPQFQGHLNLANVALKVTPTGGVVMNPLTAVGPKGPVVL